METSAGAVIFHGKEVLLVRGSENKDWGFPKGHLESGETPKQAAERETMEEVGLAIKIEDAHEKLEYSPRPGHVKRAIYFLATSKTKDVKLNPEISESTWIDSMDAAQKITHSDLRALYLRLISKLKEN